MHYITLYTKIYAKDSTLFADPNSLLVQIQTQIVNPNNHQNK